MSADPTDFIPLKPRAHLILLLLAQRPRHGYDLLTDMSDPAIGGIPMNPGSFYRLIGRLRKDGLLRPVTLPDDGDTGGGERKSYELTPLGRAVLRAEVSRQTHLIELARRATL